MNEAKPHAARKSERGNVLVYTVLSVLFLFFAVGLGVDISHLYVVKTELQNTADAAALAGASALTLPNDVKISTAVDRAVSVMNQNKYNFNNRNYVDLMSLADQRALVRFAVNLSDFDGGGNGMSEAEAIAAPDDVRFIRVTTPNAPVSIFFSGPILGLVRNLNAKAVSGLSIPGNVSVCIAPLSAVQCDPNDPNFSTCALQFAGQCPTPGIQTYTDDKGNVTTCDPTKQFCKKCTYTIRAEPAGGPSPGNYQILACAGTGASEVRDALSRYNSCKCGLKSIGDEVPIPTQPGVDAGPVRQGLNVRFDIYGGGISYSADIPPDKNIAEGTQSGQGNSQTWSGISWDQYKGSNPFQGPSSFHPGVEKRRVLIIPIIPITEFDQGRDTVNIGGLGGFFMRSQVGNGNNGDIQAEYIGDEIASVIGFDPNDTNITNIVTPVLYR